MKNIVRFFPVALLLIFSIVLLTLSCTKDHDNNNGGGNDTTIVPPPPPPPPPPPVQKWSKLADSISDGQVMKYLHGGAYNGKLYLMARLLTVSGTRYGVYEYDSSARTVSQIGAISTAQTEYTPTAFITGGVFYLHAMVNNTIQTFRGFNIDSRNWTTLATPAISTGNTPQLQAGFSIGPSGYVLYSYSPSSNQYRLYKYDPGTNTWTTATNGFTSFGLSLNSVATVMGNKAYILSYSGYLLEYNADSNQIFERARVSETSYNTFLFGENNNLHMGAGGEFSVGSLIPPGDTVTSTNIHNRHWIYTASSASWVQKENFGGSNRTEAISFVYNNIPYLLGGRLVDPVTKKAKFIFDLWKYLP